MAYSNRFIKGRIGYNTVGWPLIVIERAKSDKPLAPVFCEVFGLEHESGSVYAKEIVLASNLDAWLCVVHARGFSPADRYFTGSLLTEGNTNGMVAAVSQR